MATKESSRKLWYTISLVCFFIGILVWIPNFIFEYGYSFWLLTFVVNPIGVVFGFLGKSKLGVILNIIMIFSFFILMYIGYTFSSF